MHGICLVVGDEPKLDLERYADWDDNPDGKFDWYEIGGRFNGYLKLKKPRELSFFKRLLKRPAITEVNQARKQEIDEIAIKANPPTAILFESEWSECPMSSEQSVLQAWHRSFETTLDRVPPEALLTVVDFHS